MRAGKLRKCLGNKERGSRESEKRRNKRIVSRRSKTKLGRGSGENEIRRIRESKGKLREGN